MNNHGNYIVSLGNVCRWLATQAEELGAEIYPALLPPRSYNDDGAVQGVATGDMGVRPGRQTDRSIHPGHGTARPTARSSPEGRRAR
ncbi:MAG: hypothetical protein U1F59_09100 [Candidatus Competibacteraceae bacterium]